MKSQLKVKLLYACKDAVFSYIAHLTKEMKQKQENAISFLKNVKGRIKLVPVFFIKIAKLTIKYTKFAFALNLQYFNTKHKNTS